MPLTRLSLSPSICASIRFGLLSLSGIQLGLRTLRLLGAFLVLALTGSLAPAAPDTSQCSAVTEAAAKIRCYQDLLSSSENALGAKAQSSSNQNIDPWRMVRTPNPQGGADAISIMRTADLVKSDPELAGVMVRCRSADLEVLVVLVKALPFRAKPNVRIDGTSFVGTVVPPGAAVLLPSEATLLARRSWFDTGGLAIEVASEGQAVKGTVQMDNFRIALESLESNCPLQK